MARIKYIKASEFIVQISDGLKYERIDCPLAIFGNMKVLIGVVWDTTQISQLIGLPVINIIY